MPFFIFTLTVWHSPFFLYQIPYLKVARTLKMYIPIAKRLHTFQVFPNLCTPTSTSGLPGIISFFRLSSNLIGLAKYL